MCVYIYIYSYSYDTIRFGPDPHICSENPPESGPEIPASTSERLRRARTRLWTVWASAWRLCVETCFRRKTWKWIRGVMKGCAKPDMKKFDHAVGGCSILGSCLKHQGSHWVHIVRWLRRKKPAAHDSVRDPWEMLPTNQREGGVTNRSAARVQSLPRRYVTRSLAPARWVRVWEIDLATWV